MQETAISDYEWSSVVPAGAGAGVSVKLLLTAAALLCQPAATGAGGVVLHLGDSGQCQLGTAGQGLIPTIKCTVCRIKCRVQNDGSVTSKVAHSL